MLKRLVIGIILIYLIVIFVKLIYFKNRPEKIPYSSMIERLDASSFPSLHAARTGFLGIIFIKFFNNMIISVILAVLTVLICYSRVYLKKHDAKDVIAGIVLGILVYFGVNFIVG